MLALIPNAKVQLTGNDEIKLLFKATDDEIETFIALIRGLKGVLEVDRN
jgi:hypothetical protein